MERIHKHETSRANLFKLDNLEVRDSWGWILNETSCLAKATERNVRSKRHAARGRKGDIYGTALPEGWYSHFIQPEIEAK